MVGDTISGEVPAILNVIVLESIFRAEASHLRGIAAVCLFWIPPPPYFSVAGRGIPQELFLSCIESQSQAPAPKDRQNHPVACCGHMLQQLFILQMRTQMLYRDETVHLASATSDPRG